MPIKQIPGSILLALFMIIITSVDILSQAVPPEVQQSIPPIKFEKGSYTLPEFIAYANNFTQTLQVNSGDPAQIQEFKYHPFQLSTELRSLNGTIMDADGYGNDSFPIWDGKTPEIFFTLQRLIVLNPIKNVPYDFLNLVNYLSNVLPTYWPQLEGTSALNSEADYFYIHCYEINSSLNKIADLSITQPVIITKQRIHIITKSKEKEDNDQPFLPSAVVGSEVVDLNEWEKSKNDNYPDLIKIPGEIFDTVEITDESKNVPIHRADIKMLFSGKFHDDISAPPLGAEMQNGKEYVITVGRIRERIGMITPESLATNLLHQENSIGKISWFTDPTSLAEDFRYILKANQIRPLPLEIHLTGGGDIPTPVKRYIDLYGGDIMTQ